MNQAARRQKWQVIGKEHFVSNGTPCHVASHVYIRVLNVFSVESPFLSSKFRCHNTELCMLSKGEEVHVVLQMLDPSSQRLSLGTALAIVDGVAVQNILVPPLPQTHLPQRAMSTSK